MAKGLYTAGFSLQQTALGSRYTRPASGQNVLPLTDAVLVLSGTGSSLTNQISIANNRVKDLSGHKLSLSFTPGTGLFQGSVVVPATQRKVPFNGVVLQKQNLGRGFFVNGSQSGRVLLRAK